MSATTVSFAPHGINGAVITVILRSFSFSIIFVAMIPGTLQPVHTSRGMNDFPDNPNFLKILSIIKATRAIYPQSSSTERKKNSVSI